MLQPYHDWNPTWTQVVVDSNDQIYVYFPSKIALWFISSSLLGFTRATMFWFLGSLSLASALGEVWGWFPCRPNCFSNHVSFLKVAHESWSFRLYHLRGPWWKKEPNNQQPPNSCRNVCKNHCFWEKIPWRIYCIFWNLDITWSCWFAPTQTDQKLGELKPEVFSHPPSNNLRGFCMLQHAEICLNNINMKYNQKTHSSRSAAPF